MRLPLVAVALLGLLGSPADALVPERHPATASYNPWIAAGLTYVPMGPASVAAAFATGITSPTVWMNSGGMMAVNPMPGLGHLYVNEPSRGLGFFGASMGLALATLVANVNLYHGPRPVGVPVPWQEQVRDGVNLTYLLTATGLSLWAAWDAYSIADEKNRLGTK